MEYEKKERRNEGKRKRGRDEGGVSEKHGPEKQSHFDRPTFDIVKLT